MSNKNCLFFFFAFVPGLSTSFLTAAADKDRCRDLGEVFCLKIHRFLVFCRSVYLGIVLDTPLLSPKGDTSAEKIKENRSCLSSPLPFAEVAKISQLRRINGRKDLPHVLGKSLQESAGREFESGAKRSVKNQCNGTKIYHPHFKDQPTGSSLFFSFDAENKNNIIVVSSTAKYQETKKSDQNKKVFYAAALTSALFERKGGGSKLLLSN